MNNIINKLVSNSPTILSYNVSYFSKPTYSKGINLIHLYTPPIGEL